MEILKDFLVALAAEEHSNGSDQVCDGIWMDIIPPLEYGKITPKEAAEKLHELYMESALNSLDTLEARIKNTI